MRSRLFWGSYILECEDERVGRGWIDITKDVPIINLLVVTMRVILRQSLHQGNKGDRNGVGASSTESAALGPGMLAPALRGLGAWGGGAPREGDLRKTIPSAPTCSVANH